MNERDELGDSKPDWAAGPDVFDLPRSEVRGKSLGGILYITSSGFANLLIAFAASIVLARMLTPADFGAVAIGSTLILLAGLVADGGLGVGMIRRREPPTRTELRTLNGIQLALSLALCVPVIVVSLNFGRTGAVTAVIMASLPISMLQTPGRITLYRDMRYDRQLAIDFGSQLTLSVFTVVAVALGAGVWGLATGPLVKAVVGTIMTAALSVGFITPSLRGWRGYGELIWFGLKFQASAFAHIGRELGINFAVGAVAGVASLGIWSFTNRLMAMPLTAFNSLYMVGFPAMSNLLHRGEDPVPIILRTVRRAAIVGTLVFATFAAASPQLIVSIFGSQWRDAADIVPFLCLSTLVLGSISVAATSYLSAFGRPGVTAWAAVSFGVIWIALTVALLPVIGVTAIGLGNLVGAIVEAAILDRATRRTAGVAPYRPLLRPLAVALVAGTAGWIVCEAGPDRFWVGIAAAVVTLALSLLGLRLACRDDLNDTLRLGSEAVRIAVPRLGKPSAEGT
jgi:O-antigen/teichoic acid export membrane protein